MAFIPLKSAGGSAIFNIFATEIVTRIVTTKLSKMCFERMALLFQDGGMTDGVFT
jgi:hypothetical protein